MKFTVSSKKTLTTDHVPASTSIKSRAGSSSSSTHVAPSESGGKGNYDTCSLTSMEEMFS
jgi:hypothetical protein